MNKDKSSEPSDFTNLLDHVWASQKIWDMVGAMNDPQVLTLFRAYEDARIKRETYNELNGIKTSPRKDAS